jgi:hypothetical protein
MPGKSENVTTAKEACMNIFTKRHAQIGLALIFAILAIAAFGTSASAAGINTPDAKVAQLNAPPTCCDNPQPCCPEPPCCQPQPISVNQVVIINQEWNPYSNCCEKWDDKGGHDDWGKDKWEPYPKDDHKCCEKWDDKKDGGHDGWEKWDDKGGHDDWGKDKWDDGKHHFKCEYKVHKGDGLFSIALKYGLSWPVLARANGLSNANYIYAGQILSVPCGAKEY